MKKVLLLIICLMCLVPAEAKRKQWTEKQAWAWYKKVGVVKGFNMHEPCPAYPGQSRITVLKKAAELGFNSVRFWVPNGTVEERIEFISAMLDDAAACNLTAQPVLQDASYVNFDMDMKQVEANFRAVIRPFIKDKRVLFWDVFNEPSFGDGRTTYFHMDVIENIVKWFRDENVSQPITSSIFFWVPDTRNKALPRITEVESMMDIHNIHFYDCASASGKYIYQLLDYVNSINNRPIIATESLTRNNGSTLQRSLPIFAKYNVGFYIWGLYCGERNWEPRWGRSAYDPYLPMFHNVLYSDGEIVDAREIECVRNYRFAKPGEDLDIGLEYTDRWDLARAWRWMVSGPIVGVNSANYSLQNKQAEQGTKCNVMRVKLSFNEWKADNKAFIERMDKMLYEATDCGVSVIPVLLDDNDAHNDAAELCKYVSAVMHRFYTDTRIKAWDLYNRPGATVTDKKLISELVTLIFKEGRSVFANQPITMTPVVSVQPFEKDFNPWQALVHSRIAGWNRLQYSGGSDYELVYKIWSLSDVTSFYTEMPAAESRWLMAMCYRFGRPIFCSSWDVKDAEDVKGHLKNFSDFHVFWFANGTVPEQACGFKFNQTYTHKQ